MHTIYRTKGGVCFGYFRTSDHPLTPTVLTVISQDVITHEVTHAIMHGMNFEQGMISPLPDVRLSTKPLRTWWQFSCISLRRMSYVLKSMPLMAG